MSKNAEKIAELERLIDLVDHTLDKWPPMPPWNNDHSFEERERQRKDYYAECDRLVAELTSETGAKIDGSRPWEGCRISLAGIKSSCTGGTYGLLHNWKGAARRRIEKLRAEIAA